MAYSNSILALLALTASSNNGIFATAKRDNATRARPAKQNTPEAPASTAEPTASPTWVPTSPWPSYSPTVGPAAATTPPTESPSESPTKSPTSSPVEPLTPQEIAIPLPPAPSSGGDLRPELIKPPPSSLPDPVQHGIVIANDDNINLPVGTQEAFIGVLENDTGTGLIVRSITDDSTTLGSCSISIQLDEVVYFPPSADFIGSDECTYEACDPEDDCDTAVVTVVIKGDTTYAPTTANVPRPNPTLAPTPANMVATQEPTVIVIRPDTEAPTLPPITPFPTEVGGPVVTNEPTIGAPLPEEPTAPPIDDMSMSYGMVIDQFGSKSSKSSATKLSSKSSKYTDISSGYTTVAPKLSSKSSKYTGDTTATKYSSSKSGKETTSSEYSDGYTDEYSDGYTDGSGSGNARKLRKNLRH